MLLILLMNIIQTIDQYNIKNVFYSDPIKNNVISDSNFIRIIYSTSYVSLNGLTLFIPIINPIIEKYFNKYKCTFNTTLNSHVIEQLKNIEIELLNMFLCNDKIPQYKIVEQIQNGIIHFFANNLKKNNLFILKISGIWFNDNTYGLTYKFMNQQKH